jgi:hypothetical protein
MADVSIRKGDRLPQLDRQFTLGGTGVDLDGATVVFNMWNASSGTQVITDGSCTIVDAADGDVRYIWTSTDATLDAGSYLASFTATYGDGRKLTAPNNGMITVEIYGTTEANWSYTGNPSARPLDAVRFLSGDTDTNNQQIMDDEIAFLLAEVNSDTYLAAASACEAMASKVSAKADYSRSVGDLSLSTQYGTQSTTLLRRAERLRNQASRRFPPSVNFYQDDNNNVFGPMQFSVGIDDNNGSTTAGTSAGALD